MTLPNDPDILLSILNLKLRDFYPSLTALCEDLDWAEEELLQRLSELHYRYDAASNRVTEQ